MKIFICIVVVVLVVLFLYVAITYNSLVKLNNNVKEAFATMDVYLKKRWDLIPNLVESVKGYAAHEKDTIENVVSLRNQSYDSLSNAGKIAANTELSGALSRLLAVAENYPDLKSNANFMQLNSELSHVEEDIANSRKYYNAVVKNYNNKVEMFPSSIVAGMFGHSQKEMFEAGSSERQNVKVEF
ncbi:MAG: LemA family protein [Bacteroides sp.]